MEFAELRYVCQEAAIDLVRNRPRPIPPTVVLPGPDRTRLLTLSTFPDEDEDRHAVIAELAESEVSATGSPAWGFVAEAEISERDAVVVVFGARRNAPRITASFFGEEGELVEFAPDEELDRTAMPFLHPLQLAVDQLPALEQPPGPDESPGLPLFDP